MLLHFSTSFVNSHYIGENVGVMKAIRFVKNVSF